MSAARPAPVPHDVEHRGGRVSAPAGPRAPAWVWPAGTAVLVVAATTTLALRSPHVTGSYGFCPFLAVTGLWCPACGGLRAVHELTGLDVAAAWAMNPAVVLALPVAVGLWLLWQLSSLGLRPRAGALDRLSRWSSSRAAAWWVLGLAAAFTVARNVPVLMPWLAPL
jgi:hypothetical protein